MMLALAACSTSPASAQQAREAKPGKAATPLPQRPKATVNPCAEYGQGFVRVEGSGTCVKVGGSVSVGFGGSR
jgi:hypothetical protein